MNLRLTAMSDRELLEIRSLWRREISFPHMSEDLSRYEQRLQAVEDEIKARGIK